MLKYDDFDLDLINIKSEVSTNKWTDTPTDISCPEDTCGYACYSAYNKCFSDKICID